MLQDKNLGFQRILGFSALYIKSILVIMYLHMCCWRPNSRSLPSMPGPEEWNVTDFRIKGAGNVGWYYKCLLGMCEIPGLFDNTQKNFIKKKNPGKSWV